MDRDHLANDRHAARALQQSNGVCAVCGEHPRPLVAVPTPGRKSVGAWAAMCLDCATDCTPFERRRRGRRRRQRARRLRLLAQARQQPANSTKEAA